MREFMKKAACFLSAAVIMCGTTAISANAARNYEFGQSLTLDHSLEVSNPSTITAIVIHSDFELNKTYDEITTKEKVVLEVVQYKTLTGYDLSYQWFKDGVALNAQTKSTYEVVGTAGEFFCKITATPRFVQKAKNVGTIATASSGGAKAVTVGGKTIVGGVKAKTTTAAQISQVLTYETNKATIKTVPELTIWSQPKSGTINKSGGYYNLSIGVSGGSSSYSYEWKKRGSSTVLSTDKTYKAYNTGDYYCVVTDSKGRTKTSNYATVKTGYLNITQQPKDGIFCGYQDDHCYLTFGVNGGNGSYTYKWTCDGVEVGDNTATLDAKKAGTYVCTATDSEGRKAVSRGAVVTLKSFTANGCYIDYMGYHIKGEHLYLDMNDRSYNVYASAAGGTGRYSYSWEWEYSFNNDGTYYYDWLGMNKFGSTGSFTWDDIIHRQYYYYVYGGSGSYKRYEKRVRCAVQCLDDNGRVVAVRYTSPIVVHAHADCVNPYDPDLAWAFGD